MGAGMRGALLAALLAAGWGASGCSSAEAPGDAAAPAPPGPRPDRPDVVLVVVCSLRWDHLGFAGYPRDTTPFLDSLAAQGTVFTRAMASSTWTKPTTASLLTGLTPNVHGMTDYYDVREIQGRGFQPKRVLADEVVTLAELFSEAGYATLGRNNNVHASHFFRMMQGFDDAREIDASVRTPRMLDDLEAWLAGLAEDRPFFFFLLTRDVHVTYRPGPASYARFARDPWPADEIDERARALKRRLVEQGPATEADRRQWVDLYDAVLAELDADLARLPGILERAGRRDRTVVVVTADHGERFFDTHGAVGHGGPVFDEPLVHVPLLFHGPGVPRGVRVGDVVRSIDVYPTLAALAGIEAPDVVQGRSLLPLLDGAGPLPPASAFASFEGSAHAVRQGRHKLERRADGSAVLYDLESDPGERTDRLESDAATAAALDAELESWLAAERALREIVGRGDTRALPPEVIEQLRELGYLD